MEDLSVIHLLIRLYIKCRAFFPRGAPPYAQQGWGPLPSHCRPGGPHRSGEHDPGQGGARGLPHKCNFPRAIEI